MCSPGLVARLMGLESMPTVPRDKPRKAVDSDFYFDRRSDTSGGSSSSRHDHDLNLERVGHVKPEPSRPQKLQKTGFFDRRPVTAARLGAEALHFNRSMLTRSRKQHHKLATPVKSPRLLSRRSSARLMEAATRILEPGLQSRNRAKCALTYVEPLRRQANAEGIDAPSLKRLKEPTSTTFVSPCKSCGSLVEVADVRLNVEEPPVMEYGSNGSSASDFSNASSSSSSHDGSHESTSTPQVGLKVESRTPSFAVQAKANVLNRTNEFIERKSRQRNDLPDLIKSQQDVPQTCGLNQNNLRQNQIPLVRERVASGPKLCSRQQAKRDYSPVNASKDFIALNRNLNNCTRTRTVPKALDSRRIEMERNALDRKSLVRKRRSINSPQIENINAVNSTLSRQRRVRSDIQTGKGPSLISTRSINRNCIKSESRQGEGDSGSGNNKDTGTISFSFKAPIRHDSGSLSSARVTEKRWGRSEPVHDDTSQSDKTDEKTGKLPSQGVTALTGDALSALLEQKIRELTCLDRDELATGDGVLSARSAASILEELISALTTGGAIAQKKGDNSSAELSPKDDSGYDSTDISDCTNTHGPKLNINRKFQAYAKSGVSTTIPLANDYDQPSPVSILEASFSNDSCVSESLNSSSGRRPPFWFTERSCDKSQSWDPDTDLSDSATSTNIRRVGTEIVYPSLDDISLMQNIDPYKVEPTRGKPTYVREVISNAELLFGNMLPCESGGTVDSSIEPILLDTLETLVDALWLSPRYNLSPTEAKEGIQFRGFLFDCMIEHLDSKYSRYCKSGYKSWTKLPHFLSTDRLTREVYEEIRSWRDLAEKMILDEIIEKEMMSQLSGKWADLEVESAFEAGMEIEGDILETLVDEMVVDLSHRGSL